MNEENPEINPEPIEVHPEFYEKNLFGEVVNLTVGEELEEEGIGPKAQADFNIFALTDAIGGRKKKDAWVLYQKALVAGMVPEQVFYKLVWQMKTMLLAKRTNSPQEADMKDYPYKKAKEFLRNFKEGEVESLFQELVLGYHRARRGEGEIETLVEKTLLRL